MAVSPLKKVSTGNPSPILPGLGKDGSPHQGTGRPRPWLRGERIFMLKQISIFAANAKGALGRMTDELAKGRINIYTMLATDSAEFGIVRIIVDDANKAKDLLTKPAISAALILSLLSIWPLMPLEP